MPPCKDCISRKDLELESLGNALPRTLENKSYHNDFSGEVKALFSVWFIWKNSIINETSTNLAK